ncbi:hypothetical protein Nepgr_001471 [Nepenthes gracilis]|uniref:Uncharacterized protein n=1 Tax=Nepenthes gracilis TaxID=150966 RepID=A0AAD3P8K2_NEPGR|nr:hypothetical protein Nepgr_001471 [Nepenthes gracilis]
MTDPNKALATSIEEKLGHLPSLSADCCIYKVPENLRCMNEAAYRPLIVSIGPFYHKDERLRPMEEHKLRYLSTFKTCSVNNRALEDYIKIIREKEVKVRQQYMQNFELNSDEFTEMVMVDSVFIIELFRRLTDPTLIEENDPLFGKPQMIDDVNRDLQLLENQLPIFILEIVYNSAFSGSSFSSITCKFFNVKEVEVQNFKHFVDLLRFYYLPSSLRSSPTLRSSPNHETKFCTPVSATYLYSAGVKFVPYTDKSLLDIKFDRGSLKIPPLNLEDWTEPFFRNLMIFEQYYYLLDSYIIDYIVFLGFLIKTPNDVDILVQCGVIKNWLGNNEEVLNFFNTIVKHVRMLNSRFYYSDVCNKLDKYYNDGWNQNKAILKQKYFKHPWAAASVIYAVVILILTLGQAATGVTSNIQAGCNKHSG